MQCPLNDSRKGYRSGHGPHGVGPAWPSGGSQRSFPRDRFPSRRCCPCFRVQCIMTAVTQPSHGRDIRRSSLRAVPPRNGEPAPPPAWPAAPSAFIGRTAAGRWLSFCFRKESGPSTENIPEAARRAISENAPCIQGQAIKDADGGTAARAACRMTKGSVLMIPLKRFGKGLRSSR